MLGVEYAAAKGGGIKGGIEADEEITLDEINAITNIIDLESKPEAELKVTRAEGQKNIKYVFDTIFPHDTILEFKKKISLVTEIPIYKQHIWYEYSNKRFNLNYNVLINGKVVNISFYKNILHAPKELEYIDNIPVLVDFYNAKKLLVIKAYDSFSIIEDLNITLDVREFNLISMDNYTKNINENTFDKNQLEIIYYGFIILFWPMLTLSAWLDYVNNPTQFERIYPDLALNSDKYRKIFNMEENITNEAQDLFHNKGKQKLLKSIEDALYMGITYSHLQVQSKYNMSIINLRNLFDHIELNSTRVSCKCSILHKGKKIIFNKVYRDNEKIATTIPLRCLIIRVKHDLTHLDIYLYPDGNYSIKAKWAEESLYSFSAVFDIVKKQVNPLVDAINKLGSSVINTNAKLERMEQHNTKFVEAYLSLIYRRNIKYAEFKTLENILKDYESADIILLHDINPNTNTLEYYFAKGMYKHDLSRIEKGLVIDNSYSFLTNATIKNRWQQLFQFTRSTVFQYTHGDIKILLSGVKEKEFNIFYMYVVSMLAKIITHKQHYMPKQIKDVKQKRNIKTLKNQDPLLYDFKKLYNSPIVYSKICQRPYQPTILSEDEYKELDDKAKGRTIKYWNFTTNSDAYYHCPNTKYPYIQFTVKKHPKDYCIPCCKIKPMSDSDNAVKKLIYSTCLAEHKYQKEKTNLISDTRYIMNYGKYITPGRICNLPENSIEPLLYESFSENYSGTEEECMEQNRYYVYGIAQDAGNAANVGYITSLAFSMDMGVVDLCNEAIQRIKANIPKFRTLLDGKIYKYFYSEKELVDSIHNTFLQNDIPIENELPWNQIFIEIAYYYFNILTILFMDNSTTVYENINLLISNKINSTDQVLNPEYRSIFLIKKQNIYNPIYYINSIIYFRSSMITTKLFSSDDNIINILNKVILFDNVYKAKNSNSRPGVSLAILNDFVNSSYNSTPSPKYSTTSYFVNNNNKCYYVELKENATGNMVYFPVVFSPYVAKDINVIYDCFLIKKHKPSLKNLNTFIKYFNHWIALESEAKGYIIPDTKKFLPVEQRVTPIYDYVKVDNWLLLNNPYQGRKGSEVIGFKHKNINYYHTSISPEEAKKLSNAPYERIIYHPDDINQVLHDNPKITADPRVKNITKNIYNYHLYELLLLEYTALFNKDRNAKLRHDMKKRILDTIDLNSIETIEKIQAYIKEYYASISAKVEAHVYDVARQNEFEELEDNELIIKQVNDYLTKHHDKKLLISEIDASFYNFDKIKINSLKTKPKDHIFKELLLLAKRIVVIVPEKQLNKKLSVGDFPNMVSTCSDGSAPIYCKKDKLVLTADKLKELLHIMTDDILNPFKQKWMFNIIFTDQLINYFKFIRREHECISIEMQ
jgi:hypothetical protein